MQKGTLFLIPVPIAAETVHTLPVYVVERIHSTRHFIAESARSCRRFVKSTDPPYPISAIEVLEIPKHSAAEPDLLLAPAKNGHDVGLMSEAGCPAVADPGAIVVARAHELGIRVVPLVGPSSILLALMASGLGGQHFTFHGYLPRDKKALASEIRRLEAESRQRQCTQMCIEAPYRNDRLLEVLLNTLSGTTSLSIASMLLSTQESVVTRSVDDWRKERLPNLHKKETVFLFRAV